MPQNSTNQDIDLAELFREFWQAKLFIIIVTAIFSIASVIYALNIPDIYRSEALLAPASSQKNAGLGSLGSLGGLASLAGVNLGAAGTDKTALAIEVLSSREFINGVISRHDLLAPLLASKNWQIKTNKLIYDNEIYNPETQEWLREVNPPRQAKPSLQEAYEEFIKRLKVQQSKDNGMVTLSIEHYSPYVARLWVSILVSDLNRFMKTSDMEDAQKSLSYLEQQLEKTSVEELRKALYQLIEEQTKTLMLTQVTDEYVFKIIDPPIVSEKKAKPSRALICIVGAFLGAFLACFFVLIRFLTTDSGNN